MQRTVASDDDDVAVALAHGRHGKLRSVELMLREDRLAEDMGIAQVLGYLRKVIEPAAASGRGIDDHEPLRPLLLRATFRDIAQRVNQEIVELGHRGDLDLSSGECG